MKVKETPVITHTEILSRAIGSVEADGITMENLEVCLFGGCMEDNA